LCEIIWGITGIARRIRRRISAHVEGTFIIIKIYFQFTINFSGELFVFRRDNLDRWNVRESMVSSNPHGNNDHIQMVSGLAVIARIQVNKHCIHL
jgi:hypothetical protein